MTPKSVREKENREIRLAMRWRIKQAKMPIHPSRNEVLCWTPTQS